MSSSSKRSGSRQSRSRSASNISFRSSRTSAQQTAETGYRSPRRDSSTRQRSSSPTHSKRDPPIRSPSPSPSRAPNRKRFGLNAPSSQPRVPGKFDFEDKYPEDPIYEEMGPNARLWRVFLDECEVFDIDMVTESRDGLDLLLVFAGLFSAVLTTFVAQTSQALSTNFPAVSSALMVEMVALQRAEINNTPIDDILPADITAGPSGFDVWVNALWFTSLTLSLGTALMAVLVKQWLYQYMSMISGTARDRSLIRYYRFEGLQKWHVLTIIGTLPIVLHIALGLFLAGLVIFLIPLNTPLACVVGFITLVVYVLYAVSNILPLIYTQCPYRTPFSDILNVLLRSVRTFPSSATMQTYILLHSLGWVDMTSPNRTEEGKCTTLKETERHAATNDEVAEEVAWHALLWLYQMSSNPATKKIIHESLGCLSADVSERSKDIQVDLEQTLGEISPIHWDSETQHSFRSILWGQERQAERILRAIKDPLTRGDALADHGAPIWKLSLAESDLSFQILTSILVYAPHIHVDMNSLHWNLSSLRSHLINQQYTYPPIRLPPQLWTRLLASDDTPWSHSDRVSIGQLCDYAIQNFYRTGGDQSTGPPPPFAGPVTIAHSTVPLFHLVVDVITYRWHSGSPSSHTTDSFDFQPLAKLFTIYDYVASDSDLDFNATTTGNIAPPIVNTWAAVSRLDNGLFSDKDKEILCQRLEGTILGMVLNDEWWEDRDGGLRCRYYDNTLRVYHIHNLDDWHSNGSRFFEKLLLDLSLLLKINGPLPFGYISQALVKLLNKLHHGNTATPTYFLLFCASPFLSTRTLSSHHNCISFLYPAVCAFVRAARNMHRDVVLQSLLAEPQRLYTICWILTLGGDSDFYDDWLEHRLGMLLLLALIDPTHVVWESRVHYMTMDPRDWPYLRLIDEELEREDVITWVKEQMNEGLQILNEFFALPNTLLPGTPRHDQRIQVPPAIASGYPRHIRRLVSGAKAFLGLSSASRDLPLDAAQDVELGLQASRRISGKSLYADPDLYAPHSTTRYIGSSPSPLHDPYQLLPVPPGSDSPSLPSVSAQMRSPEDLGIGYAVATSTQSKNRATRTIQRSPSASETIPSVVMRRKGDTLQTNCEGT